MVMRAIISGKSMSGKGVVAQSMILNQFRFAWERIYVMAPTCKVDKSTWGPIEEYITNVLGGRFEKGACIFHRMGSKHNSKNYRWSCEGCEMAKGEGVQADFGNFVDRWRSCRWPSNYARKREQHFEQTFYQWPASASELYMHCAGPQFGVNNNSKK